MARFTVQVDDTYGDAAFTRLQTKSKYQGLPNEVQDEMLKVQADIVADEQRKNAQTMLNEKSQSKGYTANSINVSSPYERGGTRYIQVRFKGKRPDGKKAAEIAFLNEFGVGNAAHDGAKIYARGFIAKANRSASDRALAAADAVFRKWQDNNE